VANNGLISFLKYIIIIRIADCTMKTKKIYVLIIIILGVVGLLRPQMRNRGINFKHITQDQGLSQNSVFCILQDNKGFMWFGTQDGLNKYDGYNFKVYRPDPENPFSLSENNITSLCEDREGNLWIGTAVGGLNKFDREKEAFFHYRSHPDNPTGLSIDFITVICQDRPGNLWIGTPGGGLDKFNPGTGIFVHYRNRDGDPGSLSSNGINALCEGSDGLLWVGTAGGGLNEFDPRTGTFKHYRADPGNPRGLLSDTVTSLCEDHAGELWVGTTNGLHLLDRQTGTFTRFVSNPDEPFSLSHNNILSLYEDHAGVLWVGTIEGLNRLDRRKEQFVRYRYDADDPFALSNDSVVSIYENRSGILWVGTGGGGVNKFDRQANAFVTYRADPGEPDSISHDFVYSFCEGRDRVLWVGTSGGGLNRMALDTGKTTVYRNIPDDPHSLSSDYIFCVLVDRSGIVWIGTQGAGLDRFVPGTGSFIHYRNIPLDFTSLSSNSVRVLYEDRDGFLWVGTFGGGLVLREKTGTFRTFRNIPGDPTSLVNNFIRSIYEDRAGTLWIGTNGSGLNKFDRQTGKFTRYFRRLNDPTSLANNIIGVVYEDRSGSLWIGTLGGGLNLMDRDTGTFTHFREKHGLPNDVVYGILEDEQGFLWLSTNMGISRFDPRTRAFKNYNINDGLQSNEFNGGAFYKGQDSRMYFGGVRGFNAFYPDQITDNPHVPAIVITDFLVFNRPAAVGPGAPLKKHISEAREIKLSHKENAFSFEFVALDFTIPEKNRYAYRLEGFDKDWIYTTSDKRFAAYTNLSPGGYIFRVKGSNNDGVWNEQGTSIKIIITPPVWKTWWFQLLAVLAALGLAAALYRFRMKGLSQKTRLQTELQTARDAQMSIMPQFDPDVPGFDVSGICEPASEVGGDFFDYIWLNEQKTKFGIAIGDVSGKAMKAAMTAVMSDGILFSKANESDSIKEIMTRVNRPLYFKTDKKMFTALCLVSLDTQTKALIFTNAGLNHPLLKAAGSGAVTPIKGEGSKFPLGMFRDNVYQEKQTPLKNGDVLVLFTDGMLDTQNAAGEFYGYGKLKARLEDMDTENLSASAIKEGIIADALAFAGTEPQKDDITVVVVKVTGNK
jgi:ligand-binding sensor domain-containing protein/serine phosphatase RsbU (regulator of sigma subunit)